MFGGFGKTGSFAASVFYKWRVGTRPKGHLGRPREQTKGSLSTRGRRDFGNPRSKRQGDKTGRHMLLSRRGAIFEGLILILEGRQNNGYAA